MRRAKRKKLSKASFSLQHIDKPLLLLTVFLSSLGVLAVLDASAPQALAVFQDSYYFAKQQVKWMAIGFAALTVSTFLDYRFWKKYAVAIFTISILLLFLVLIPGVSSQILGARRWLSLGPLSFQPSEFAKIALAILVAYLLDKKAPFWKIMLYVGAYALFVVFQPDLGTTIVLVTIGFSQVFVAGMPVLNFLLTLVIGSGSAVLAVLLSGYRRDRLISFLETLVNPLNASYHMKQILYALGSGGLLGVGIGQSRQKQLFLPETANDSVFAVLAEEIGFLGSLVVIALLVFFVMRILKIARKAPDLFSKTLAVGIGVWIGGQMFLNIASMVALTPLTGIPLPFFSYGGSSLVMILLGIGILLNISAHAEK